MRPSEDGVLAIALDARKAAPGKVEARSSWYFHEISLSKHLLPGLDPGIHAAPAATIAG